MQTRQEGPTAVATARGMEFVHNPLDEAGEAQLEAAARDWRSLPESHPDRAWGEALLAFAAGDYEAARQTLAERVQEQPYLLAERRMLAQAALVTGDFQAAESHAGELIERGFEESTAYSIRAYARAGMGRFEDAVEDMRRSLERRPLELARRNYLAFWLYQLGRSEEALPEYDRLVEAAPESVTYRIGRSNVRMALGDWEGALGDANRAVELDPDDPEVHYQRAVTLHGGPGAVEEFTRAIELDPGYLTAIGQRGLVLITEGRFEEAERDGRVVVEAEPEFPHWKYVLGAALRGLGRYREASDVLDAGVAQGLEYPEVYTDRARARAGLGRCAEAWSDLARAEAFGEGLDPEAVAEIADRCPKR
jgi:tetratricopeptide (TPR) repeat protein